MSHCTVGGNVTDFVDSILYLGHVVSLTLDESRDVI